MKPNSTVFQVSQKRIVHFSTCQCKEQILGYIGECEVIVDHRPGKLLLNQIRINTYAKWIQKRVQATILFVCNKYKYVVKLMLNIMDYGSLRSQRRDVLEKFLVSFIEQKHDFFLLFEVQLILIQIPQNINQIKLYVFNLYRTNI